MTRGTICKRCTGTGFDPVIDLPGTCDHSGRDQKRFEHFQHRAAPLPALRRAVVLWLNNSRVVDMSKVRPRGPRIKPVSQRSIDDGPGSLYTPD